MNCRTLTCRKSGSTLGRSAGKGTRQAWGRHQHICPSMDEIAAAIDGIGSITAITEAKFEQRVEIWRKWVMQEKGHEDLVILKYSNNVIDYQ